MSSNAILLSNSLEYIIGFTNTLPRTAFSYIPSNKYPPTSASFSFVILPVPIISRKFDNLESLACNIFRSAYLTSLIETSAQVRFLGRDSASANPKSHVFRILTTRPPKPMTQHRYARRVPNRCCAEYKKIIPSRNEGTYHIVLTDSDCRDRVSFPYIRSRIILQLGIVGRASESKIPLAKALFRLRGNDLQSTTTPEPGEIGDNHLPWVRRERNCPATQLGQELHCWPGKTCAPSRRHGSSMR